MSEILDALIIGGGPGGATAAALLSSAGWTVAVVEKKAFPRSKVCGEYVSATNRPLFGLLGIADAYVRQAGPGIQRVGLFAGSASIVAPMPQRGGIDVQRGHALRREKLDTLLLDTARQRGATVWQPWAVTQLNRETGGFRCRLVSKDSTETPELRSRIVIAAHGSWNPGQLPTQPPRLKPRGSDLFGFKARFARARLPEDLMPLIVFPGGYGGLVQSDSGSLSLSCCVRRDAIERIRQAHGQTHESPRAVEAVVRHIVETCVGVRHVLEGAEQDGPGLAVGPIRPGIRRSPEDGIFLVGNAAGEAHPIIAEGISMAMQSALLLSRTLIPGRSQFLAGNGLQQARIDYELAWRRAFASRLHASWCFAQFALHSPTAHLGRMMIARFPTLLSWGAEWSGKTHPLAT